MSYAFLNGEFMPLEQARVGVMTHALHYGTSVFEGIRGNWNEDEGKLFVFRLREHCERLLQGCKIMRISLPYSADDLCGIIMEVVERSGYRQDIYVRPLAFKGEERIAVLKLQDVSDSLCVVTVTSGSVPKARTRQWANVGGVGSTTAHA